MSKYKNRGIRTMAAAAVLAAALMSGCQNDRLEDQLSYRQIGINALAEGDYEGAITAFDSALSYSVGKIGETELDICYYKAAAQYASGDTAGALATYDAMIDYDKEDANAYYLRGCLQLLLGETPAAQADFASAVEYNSSDYELYINIYENLTAYNLASEGETYLNEAFSIKGDDAEHLCYRGRLYFLLGQYDNAVTELLAALDKGSVEANLTLAQVYEAQGDSATAETYYMAYVDSGVADSAALNALAEIEMGKINYTGALTYINQALAMEEVTNKRALMQNQIICMEYTADFAGAWAVMQEYMALYPDDMEALREYIFLKNRQGVQEAGGQDEAPAADSTEQAPAADSTEQAPAE